MEPSQEELLDPLIVEKAFEITREYEETAQQGQRSVRQLLRRIRVANEESKTSSGCRAALERQLWRSKHIFYSSRDVAQGMRRGPGAITGEDMEPWLALRDLTALLRSLGRAGQNSAGWPHFNGKYASFSRVKMD
jgi:hypothetical protein